MQKIETGFSELLNKQPKTAEEKDADIHELQSAVQTLLQEVRNLDEFVALLRKKQFGTSSEVTPTKEEDLPLGMFPEAELEYKENAPEPFKKDRRGVHKRNELEQWKLVNSNSAEDRIADLEDKTCPRCGSQMVRIGKELVREVFEYVPAKLKLVRYWQVSYTCPACKKNGRTVIVRGAVPKPLLNHSSNWIYCILYSRNVEQLSSPYLAILRASFGSDFTLRREPAPLCLISNGV